MEDPVVIDVGQLVIKRKDYIYKERCGIVQRLRVVGVVAVVAKSWIQLLQLFWRSCMVEPLIV